MKEPVNIYFRPLFHPGTTDRISMDELQAQIAERQRIIRKHAGHDVTKAFAEMLDLQAVRMTAEAMDPDEEKREHKAGQAFAASYLAGVLRQVMDYREPDNDEESEGHT